jgi:hypothetical protein
MQPHYYELTASTSGGDELCWIFDPRDGSFSPPLPKDLERWISDQGGVMALLGKPPTSLAIRL